MNDRLDKLLLAEQLTPAKFADIIGVQRSSISHIISGRNKPSFDFIAKVMQKFPRLNSEWLILGKGDMYKRMVQTSLFDEPAIVEPQPKVYSPDLQVNSTSYDKDDDLQEEIADEPQKVEKKDSIGINEAVGQLFEKDIERIIVFYKDRTFRSYTASAD